MKSDDRSSSPKVRIAVLGNMDVGKSGKLICKLLIHSKIVMIVVQGFVQLFFISILIIMFLQNGLIVYIKLCF